MKHETRAKRDEAMIGFERVYNKDLAVTRWQLTCTACKTAHQFGWAMHAGKEMLLRNLHKAGWVAGVNVPAVCPACTKLRGDKVVKTQTRDEIKKGWRDTAMSGASDRVMTQVKPSLAMTIPQETAIRTIVEEIEDMAKEAEAEQAEPTVTPGPQPSMKISRKVMSLLEEFFDEDKKLYKGTCTDHWVAKEVGTSEQVVVRIRREAFGELAEDPTITQFRRHLDQIDDRITKLMEESSQMRAKIEKYAAARKV